MDREFPKAGNRAFSMVAFLGAIFLATLLFLVIPFTQSLIDVEKEISTFREVIIIPPPVIDDLVPPEEIPEEVLEEPLPELEQELQELSLNQLEISLNPGIGDALSMGIKSHNLQTQVNVIGDIKQIFTFKDLPQAPRRLNMPSFTFPSTLIKKGVAVGTVVLLVEINPKGRVEVLEILSSTHKSLEGVAVSFARRSRFTIPKIDGVPRTVRGNYPVTLCAP
jgi:TonB family protein